MALASMEEVLPLHMHVEILNCVKDARDLANCMAVSKGMCHAVRYIKNLNLVCLKKYYHLQRERFPIRAAANSDDEDEAEEEEIDVENDDEDERGEDDDCCGGSTPRPPPPACQYPNHIPFKQVCLGMLEHANTVEQLRIEIEPEMQANPFQKDELHLVDFWLSEPMFVRKWVSHCSQSLQHLCLVDYGQQAIMRQSPIVRILSEHCKLRWPPKKLSWQIMFSENWRTIPNIGSLCSWRGEMAVCHCHADEECRQREQNEARKKPPLHSMDEALCRVVHIASDRSIESHLYAITISLRTEAKPQSVFKFRKRKALRTLELRNMFVDTDDLHILPKVTSLTLRCIKMTEKSLTDINICMPALQTLALVSVFGVQEARIESPSMLVLCLGLSTKARVVDLDLPNVHKLQLKMTCPDFLRVCAPNLAYVAVCMEKREGATVKFEQVSHLRELLFGASQFWTLSKLIKGNPSLEKVFLDVPCMALGEDGKWEGVLHQVPTRLPDVKALEDSCPYLHTLSLGPGIWHSIEIDFKDKRELSMVRKWPDLKRLIVHMIIQSLETCLSVLVWLVGALPSLEKLEIYVHTDSHVELGQFVSDCKKQISHTDFKSGPWKKSLCFACFSF